MEADGLAAPPWAILHIPISTIPTPFINQSMELRDGVVELLFSKWAKVIREAEGNESPTRLILSPHDLLPSQAATPPFHSYPGEMELGSSCGRARWFHLIEALGIHPLYLGDLAEACGPQSNTSDPLLLPFSSDLKLNTTVYPPPSWSAPYPAKTKAIGVIIVGVLFALLGIAFATLIIVRRNARQEEIDKAMKSLEEFELPPAPPNDEDEEGEGDGGWYGRIGRQARGGLVAQQEIIVEGQDPGLEHEEDEGDEDDEHVLLSAARPKAKGPLII